MCKKMVPAARLFLASMTGLFFGSFNPVHTGHLIIAEFMRVQVPLEEVWFVVSPQNPFKKENELANARERLRMVRLAVAGNRKLKASDVEFDLPKPSYSVATLSLLKKKYPDKKFAIIMGSDNLDVIHKWKNYEEILQSFTVLVYRRGNNSEERWKRFANVLFFSTPLLDISSTMIRRLIAEKKSVRYLVPDKVLDHLLYKKIYEGGKNTDVSG